MSDLWKKEPPSRPTAPDGDEEIIDLVEELSEENPRQPLSELERRLLDFGDPTPDAGATAADLPDLADLGSFDFDEEDDETPAGAEAGSEADAGLTSAESDDRPTARGNEIEEVSEFDEQLLDAEDILDVEEILAGPSPAKKDSEPETDEGLELLDIEEEEIDDEIVWFDDLDPAAPPAEPAAADAPSQATALDWGTDPGRETSALDVFAAHVESALPEADPAPAPAAAAGAVTASAAAAAAFQPPAEPEPGAPPPASESAETAITSGLSSAEIEAAVERVIERKLGGTIESIIQQAIEKAVSKEIERLKRLLLEDDDRSPAA